MKKHLVSVIIPTYNEENHIENCLNSLRKQSFKDFEIIVVDDGSKDKTIDKIKNFKEAKIIVKEHSGRGPASSKNLGVKRAKGNILVFVDADEILDKNYIKRLIDPIKKGKSKVSVGVYKIYQPKNAWARCKYKNTKQLFHQSSKVFRAIKKDKLLKVGGFNTKKGYSDDQVEGLGKIYKVKNALFYHNVDTGIKEVYHKSKWIGKSVISNPKSGKFFIKIGLMLIFLALIGIFSIINKTIVYYLLILALLGMLLLVVKKAISYKDIRLIFYSPIFLIVSNMGLFVGLFNDIIKRIKR